MRTLPTLAVALMAVALPLLAQQTHASTGSPSFEPSASPTWKPSVAPTEAPSHAPTLHPTHSPTHEPTEGPTESPTDSPTKPPSRSPTLPPSHQPTRSPTHDPTHVSVFFSLTPYSERERGGGGGTGASGVGICGCLVPGFLSAAAPGGKVVTAASSVPPGVRGFCPGGYNMLSRPLPVADDLTARAPLVSRSCPPSPPPVPDRADVHAHG